MILVTLIYFTVCWIALSGTLQVRDGYETELGFFYS